MSKKKPPINLPEDITPTKSVNQEAIDMITGPNSGEIKAPKGPLIIKKTPNDRTSVLIPKKLHRELRIEAFKLDVSMGEYVTFLLSHRDEIKAKIE